MRLKAAFTLLVLLAGVLMIAPLAARAQSNTCPALVNRALSEIGTNCANLERNSACYGYNQVDASFSQTVPDNFFSEPSDRAALNLLQSIQTAPLDELNNRWGIVTLDVQASLPGALPGQNVVFILLGGVAIENAVAPEDMITLPEEPLAVISAQAAELRRRAGPDAEIVGTIEAETPLLADGISPDGEWLRVFFMADRLAVAWVSRAALKPVRDVSMLPAIGPDSRTPMQAFHFQTGFGGVDCAEAPSLLFIQGPENVEVDINANGADIRIGSSIILRTLADGSLQIIVVAGGATLNPNSDSPIYLPPGFTAICPADDIASGNCDWQPPRLITLQEEAELEHLQPLFANVSNLLHYTPSVPEVVCASGAGSVICELRFENPETALRRAAEQCALGQLPRSMCAALFPGS